MKTVALRVTPAPAAAPRSARTLSWWPDPPNRDPGARRGLRLDKAGTEADLPVPGMMRRGRHGLGSLLDVRPRPLATDGTDGLKADGARERRSAGEPPARQDRAALGRAPAPAATHRRGEIASDKRGHAFVMTTRRRAGPSERHARTGRPVPAGGRRDPLARLAFPVPHVAAPRLRAAGMQRAGQGSAATSDAHAETVDGSAPRSRLRPGAGEASPDAGLVRSHGPRLSPEAPPRVARGGQDRPDGRNAPTAPRGQRRDRDLERTRKPDHRHGGRTDGHGRRFGQSAARGRPRTPRATVLHVEHRPESRRAGAGLASIRARALRRRRWTSGCAPTGPRRARALERLQNAIQIGGLSARLSLREGAVPQRGESSRSFPRTWRPRSGERQTTQPPTTVKLSSAGWRRRSAPTSEADSRTRSD